VPVSLQSTIVVSKNEHLRNVECRIATLRRAAALNRTPPNVQWLKTQPVSCASDQSTSWKAQSS
jgi:hypothetical protein